MPAFTMDVWFGSRILGRSPWFTAIVVLTLGLGIAVNTTVFSWINSVLLHPFLGVGDPQELALTKLEWQTRPLTLPGSVPAVFKNQRLTSLQWREPSAFN
jgi:hypothetical protein